LENARQCRQAVLAHKPPATCSTPLIVADDVADEGDALMDDKWLKLLEGEATLNAHRSLKLALQFFACETS